MTPSARGKLKGKLNQKTASARRKLGQQVFFGGKVGARQQQQAREERPEHHAHGEREGAVDFLEIQPGQSHDIGIFQRFRKQSHNDGGGQHGPRGDFAIGQQPVNQKEDGDAGGDGEDFHHQESDQAHHAAAVSVQQEFHK